MDRGSVFVTGSRKRTMSASVPRLRATEPIDRVTDALHEHGAAIVEGVLDPDLLARFNAELDPILAGVSPQREYLNPALQFFYGDRVRQITGVASRSRVFGEEILPHPFYGAICDAILGPSCANYQLNVAQVMDRGPGAEQQLLHRDETVWVHLPRPHPEVQVASVIALVDFTAELGATVVAPGSHRWEPERYPNADELCAAEMPAGAAVVYLGSTLHGGGRNTTDRWRRAMHMSFVVGWLRSEDNNYLSTPPDVARTLPRRSQELLGYAAHDAFAAGGGYLGAVDLLDPVELLARGKL
jgi:ectoine hydroxylase-related dioxygenase (phytanoyl-CoA dioxygenase family)